MPYRLCEWRGSTLQLDMILKAKFGVTGELRTLTQTMFHVQ